MSAPALRAPAPAWRVARHYLRLLVRMSTVFGILMAVQLGSAFQRPDEPAGVLRALFPMMLILPLLHWLETGRPGLLEAGLPVDVTRHLLLRIACGTAWAAITLLPAVAVFLVQVETRDRAVFPDAPYPSWYPLTVVVMGVTCYLLGSAAWLRFQRPLAWALLGIPVIMLLLSPLVLSGWLSRGMFASLAVPTTAREGMGTSGSFVSPIQWMAGAGLGLAVASACVVWAAATYGGPQHPAGRGFSPRRRRSAPVPAAAPALRAGPAGTLRRPPGMGTVLRHQAVLLAPRLVLPGAVALLLALWTAVRAFQGSAEPQVIVLAVLVPGAFLWPLLVWMDERGRPGEHEDALPVRVETNRLARVAVGAAYLMALVLGVTGTVVLAAWAAGGLPSPGAAGARIWLGVPGLAMIMYLLSSAPILAVRHSAAIVLVHLEFPLLWYSKTGALSLRAAFSALDPELLPGANWALAQGFWIALAAAAVCAAVVVRAQVDRRGGWRTTPDPAAGASW